MKAITIRQLHDETGRRVRQAVAQGELQVTERGKIIAKLVPASPLPTVPYFARPRYTKSFLAHRRSFRGGTDATQMISEDRDRPIA